MLAQLLLGVLLLSGDPGDAMIRFGRAEIDKALTEAGFSSLSGSMAIRVREDGGPESFQIRFDEGRAEIEGGDAAGAMYGALELAERIRLNGEKALSGGTVSAAPWLEDRGVNIFLTLPWNYEKNTTDYDPEALTDPERWWFQNDGFWRTLFDLMARSRLNWLDIHGTWDVSVTNAPNLYAYFIQSLNYPEVGVRPEIKAANLKQLNRVIAMARERGIRVSLMAYEARFSTPHNPDQPYEETEANVYEYTREVVEAMIRLAPGLDTIGFRIGESGRGGEFFNCYLEAVERSGRDIPLITRSWVTRKAKVVPLARGASDFTVEIKYNGEQWAAPYMAAGGRVAGWYSYSFEDYLSDSGDAPARRMWPGNPADPVGSGRWPDDPGPRSAEGGRWPDQPYKIVWQVRANGTHRILPFYEPEWVRRSIRCMKIGTASGYTVEPLNAYYPASPRYYLADPEDAWCDWIHQRDSLYYLLWGRLGYDPDIPADVLDALAASELGEGSDGLLQAWKRASRIVPSAFCAYSIGPDHRNHAPELEWGGGTEDFILREPFDTHSFRSIKESLAYKATDVRDGRLVPGWLARPGAALAHAMVEIPDPPRGTRLFELWNAVTMAHHLADYYSGRFAAALGFAEAASAGGERRSALLTSAAGCMQKALDAWKALSESPEARFYKPFTERLRMHTNDFHWKNELPRVEKETQRIMDAAGGDGAVPEAETAVDRPFPVPPDTAVLSWRNEGEDVVCTVPAEGLENAWLLVKPLPSSTFFHKVSMELADTEAGRCFIKRFSRENCGHAIAAEIEFIDPEDNVRTVMRRIPLWEAARPYLVVPSRRGPTPAYYSSEEAMTFLKPGTLDPDLYGQLLLCTRAWNFHRSFDVPTQRKLLDAVGRGMDLLVLQQDYTSGRYPLEWLPVRPRLSNRSSTVFDPGGALGLERIEADGILWQPFEACEGWDVFGNGGVARLKHGKGSIWMVQARLMQNMHLPECARALVRLLGHGGDGKPVVVVDAGTEGAHYATSVFVDLMNAHAIPFLTLGEVIARKQGVACFSPVPGRTWNDRILDGRGPQIMKTFLESRVKNAARRPVPSNRDAFETLRRERKKELMRCLGLDPLPPRTPLKARITGLIENDGYTLEKIVFESRPGFPVTAHLYVPEGDGKRPVVVNPHGHWRHKKMEPRVQTRAAAQALAGYLAVVVDSPGYSFEGDALIERRWAGSHFDLQLTLGSANATAVYVWDLMRCLDYLATRPEADMTRVGITGTSGGGLATLYAFAADERFTCAVPVCYATSLEVNPYNGCPCNHVPGTLQIGDRADVLAIRAPAPVFVIGAQNDTEFPPEGTRLTGEKLEQSWTLFDAADRVAWRIFDCGHDYNKDMREAALGFLDLHLRGRGDGSPVPEPEIATADPESHEHLCLPDPPNGLLTLAGIAAARLSTAGPAGFEEVAALNGGLPKRSPLRFERKDGIGIPDNARYVTFESEPGLVIPGILLLPEEPPHAAAVLVSERGKTAALVEFRADELAAHGIACLAIDVRGTGELQGLDPRLTTYLGTAAAFGQGWDAARAAEALEPLAPRTAVIGRGPCASQAVLFAALMEESIDFAAGIGVLRSYADCFDPGVPVEAIQPRAAYGAPLDHLRSLVRAQAVWTFMGEDEPDTVQLLLERLPALEERPEKEGGER